MLCNGAFLLVPLASDGVDVTLIHWMLAMTPAERLAVLQEFVDFVQDSRGAHADEPVRVRSSDAG